MAEGSAPDCLTSQTLQNQPNNGLTDLEIAYTVSSPFGAGIETVGNITTEHISLLNSRQRTDFRHTMCLFPSVSHYTHVWPTDLKLYAVAMLHYPDVMRKAQAELDKVIGSDRLPSFDDRESLPYLNAVINETLRWRPIAVLGGTPHAVTADDEYNGM